MERIASFCVDHTKLDRGMYLSRQDGVIYVGPMGCRTGFYLLTRGLTPAEALALTVDSFRFMAAFEGAVPGASEVECGNYRDMDLPKAKAEAAAMLPVLEALTADQLHY